MTNNFQVSSLLMTDSNNSRDSLLDISDVLPLPVEINDNALFAGSFVPPPPRPLFLEEDITSDGLTTCDLCSWAWQSGNSNIIDTKLESAGELGWIFTLIIVSLTSAVLGAIVMIIVLHFKRLKNPNGVNRRHRESPDVHSTPNRSPVGIRDDKIAISSQFPSNQSNISGVWSWLSRRSTTNPSQLENSSLSFVENHYIHMEDCYNSVDDALYAELDIESTVNKDNNPAYQNSAYTDSDAPISSAPSSAYYSDLSVTTYPDRAYEIVSLSAAPICDAACNIDAKKHALRRLAVISETVNVPSDYV